MGLVGGGARRSHGGMSAMKFTCGFVLCGGVGGGPADRPTFVTFAGDDVDNNDRTTRV